VASLLTLPLDVLRAIADIPLAIERNMRRTHELVGNQVEQLRRIEAHGEAMLEQLQAMLEQMQTTRAVTERLVEATEKAAAASEGTREQMAATREEMAKAHAQVERMNEQLEGLLRLGAPVERAQRRGDRLGALLGRRGRSTNAADTEQAVDERSAMSPDERAAGRPAPGT
jgi:chromosome segregation ATPase